MKSNILIILFCLLACVLNAQTMDEKISNILYEQAKKYAYENE